MAQARAGANHTKPNRHLKFPARGIDRTTKRERARQKDRQRARQRDKQGDSEAERDRERERETGWKPALLVGAD